MPVQRWMVTPLVQGLHPELLSLVSFGLPKGWNACMASRSSAAILGMLLPRAGAGAVSAGARCVPALQGTELWDSRVPVESAFPSLRALPWAAPGAAVQPLLPSINAFTLFVTLALLLPGAAAELLPSALCCPGALPSRGGLDQILNAFPVCAGTAQPLLPGEPCWRQREMGTRFPRCVCKWRLFPEPAPVASAVP